MIYTDAKIQICVTILLGTIGSMVLQANHKQHQITTQILYVNARVCIQTQATTYLFIYWTNAMNLFYDRFALLGFITCFYADNPVVGASFLKICPSIKIYLLYSSPKVLGQKNKKRTYDTGTGNLPSSKKYYVLKKTLTPDTGLIPFSGTHILHIIFLRYSNDTSFCVCLHTLSTSSNIYYHHHHT